jgi:regulator of protease activity HflC (stomatin/prohibitin superfamily)
LVGGRAEITFEETFQEAVSPEIPVKVVLTAQGAPSGLLYVASKSNQGFSVERLEIPDLAIKSDDITFDWIAIAREKGYEQRPEVVMEGEGAMPDQINREEALRAEELEHQKELERDALFRQQMREKQAQKEAERVEEEKEEQSTD